MGMEVGRTEFHIEIRDLSADPSFNDIVPGLIRPGDIALRRVLAFRRTAGSDDGGNTQYAQVERQHGSTSHHQLLSPFIATGLPRTVSSSETVRRSHACLAVTVPASRVMQSVPAHIAVIGQLDRDRRV